MPCRIDCIERQQTGRRRLGKRAISHRSDIRHGNTYRLCDYRVESQEPATHEIIGNLVFQCIISIISSAGIVTIRKHRLIRLVLPRRIIGTRGIKLIQKLCRHARLPGSVRHGTDCSDTIRNHLFMSIILRGGNRNHPVTIESGSIENRLRIRSIVNTDFILVNAEIRQNLFRGAIQAPARVRRRIYIAQFQHTVPVQDRVLVLDDGSQPLGSLHDLLHHYLSILVRIKKFQRLSVKFQPVHRTTQHRPQFLVKFSKMGDILSGTDFHPDCST